MNAKLPKVVELPTPEREPELVIRIGRQAFKVRVSTEISEITPTESGEVVPIRKPISRRKRQPEADV
ncbi:MAG: hypothetical protein IT168_33355 [Bryobacterales bacterium]|nr:hypothetical protein [Bryobacterales bacterium]